MSISHSYAQRFYRCITALLAVMLLLSGCRGAPQITSTPQPAPVHDSQYWISMVPDEDNVILSMEQIQSRNRLNYANPETKMVDLSAENLELSGGELRKALESVQRYKFENQYVRGVHPSQGYQLDLIARMDFEQLSDDEILQKRMAVAICRSDIRAFPTQDAFLSDPADVDFDNIQSGVLLPAEAALVLHESADSLWYYVQGYNCSGWVLAEDIALTQDRTLWLDFLQGRDFLLICANRMPVENAIESGIAQSLYMGTRLPLLEVQRSGDVINAYVVGMPRRSVSGTLEVFPYTISSDLDVYEGYLPYTSRSALQQGFKCLGDVYGWGGMYDSRDCSSFTGDIYRCFGMALGRNTTWQPKCAGIYYDTENLSHDERVDLIEDLESGALLFFPGHVMLYLGASQGDFYVLHSFYSYATEDGERQIARAIDVSPLSLRRYTTSETFLDSLTSVLELR